MTTNGTSCIFMVLGFLLDMDQATCQKQLYNTFMIWSSRLNTSCLSAEALNVILLFI